MSIPEESLTRITTHLSRYTCAGPIPLTFAASLGDADITIEAIATVPDACAARDGTAATVEVRHRGGVACDADERTIGDQVAMLARVAVLHELGEFLCFDGEPLKDPHRGPGGRS